jgi:hypothetical protein
MAPYDRKGIKKFESAGENGKLRVSYVNRLPNPSGIGVFLLWFIKLCCQSTDCIAHNIMMMKYWKGFGRKLVV